MVNSWFLTSRNPPLTTKVKSSFMSHCDSNSTPENSEVPPLLMMVVVPGMEPGGKEMMELNWLAFRSKWK